MSWRILAGDCIEQMRSLPDASIDAVVTDPPYGIGFMGHEWDQPGEYGPVAANGDPQPFSATSGDRRPRRRQPSPSSGAGHARDRDRAQLADGERDHTKTRARGDAMHAGRYDLSLTANQRFQAWCEAWATEALRVLKPGGHLLVFGGTRTYHRLAAGVEDAGFEIRDCLAWLFGSGFPKSLDVAKAIDARLGATREVVDEVEIRGVLPRSDNATRAITEPATPEAQQWDGWGTALKPAFEPIVFARKPLAGTVAATVLEHGTGALNIDACRIGVDDQDYARNHSGDRGHAGTRSLDERGATDLRPGGGSASDVGRWPANVVLDPEAGALLDEQTGELTSGANPTRRGTDKVRDVYGDFKGQTDITPARGADSGGASRFFYCAKASSAERNAGLDAFEARGVHRYGAGIVEGHDPDAPSMDRNVHPTVKPIDLMRWLVRLVTPPGGTVLDPFTGSGSTGCAVVLEGFDFVGCEREADYIAIAEARIAWWEQHAGEGDAADLLAAGAARAEHAQRGQTSIFDAEAAA